MTITTRIVHRLPKLIACAIVATAVGITMPQPTPARAPEPPPAPAPEEPAAPAPETEPEPIKITQNHTPPPPAFDIDALACAVSKHETCGCTCGIALPEPNPDGVNNCFGIKDKSTGRPRDFATQADAFAEFKSLWQRAYGGFPTHDLASKYVGGDGTAWLAAVTKLYRRCQAE